MTIQNLYRRRQRRVSLGYRQRRVSSGRRQRRVSTFTPTGGGNIIVPAAIYHGYETRRWRCLYSNINGGVGIFASRRTHITVNVPADSAGNPDNLPQRLVDLGVGFYGRF